MNQTNTVLQMRPSEKITALYLRISREDEEIGISNSISNQKDLLEEFSQKNGFVNVKTFADDGISGVTFQRNEFKKLINLVENHKIGILIVKDLSRLGRNYLEVGNLTENVFPMYNVRFISVNDGVDSTNGEDDFNPFRNIMNEWYAKDISRKVRSSLKTKSKKGFAIGFPPRL